MTERLTEIEIKLAHLEDAVNAMSDMVYNQQAAIDRIATFCKHLQQRVEAIEPADGAEPGDEKPPHY